MYKSVNMLFKNKVQEDYRKWILTFKLCVSLGRELGAPMDISQFFYVYLSWNASVLSCREKLHIYAFLLITSKVYVYILTSTNSIIKS